MCLRDVAVSAQQSTPDGAKILSHLLSGAGLTLSRGDRCLLRNLDFALDAGELLLVEGPNGSGKTSLLRGIAGLLEFEAGDIRWRGEPVNRAFQQYRADIAWLSHRIGFKYDLTIMENLEAEAGLRPTRTDAAGPVLERLGLARLLRLPLRSLSAGQQRRVALARLLLASATVWIMDEPLTNLDAAGQSLVTELVAAHLADGGACVIASHQPIATTARVRQVLLH